jgi:hypothetical protein
MVTTARRSLQRLADRYNGSQKLATPRGWLRRLAEACNASQMVTTARRSLRRSAEDCNGSQIVTTVRRRLQRPADRYDGPQIVTTGRRWLRRAADGYDEPQILLQGVLSLRRAADPYDEPASARSSHSSRSRRASHQHQRRHAVRMGERVIHRQPGAVRAADQDGAADVQGIEDGVTIVDVRVRALGRLGTAEAAAVIAHRSEALREVVERAVPGGARDQARLRCASSYTSPTLRSASR